MTNKLMLASLLILCTSAIAETSALPKDVDQVVEVRRWCNTAGGEGSEVTWSDQDVKKCKDAKKKESELRKKYRNNKQVNDEFNSVDLGL
jgi:hypothetical protein